MDTVIPAEEGTGPQEPGAEPECNADTDPRRHFAAIKQDEQQQIADQPRSRYKDILTLQPAKGHGAIDRPVNDVGIRCHKSRFKARKRI
jgi:hypothetical protein